MLSLFSKITVFSLLISLSLGSIITSTEPEDYSQHKIIRILPKSLIDLQYLKGLQLEVKLN